MSIKLGRVWLMIVETMKLIMSVPTPKSDSQMTPRDKPKSTKAKNQKEGPIDTKGLLNICADGKK